MAHIGIPLFNVEAVEQRTGGPNQHNPNSCELQYELLKRGLYRDYYRGLFRGILGV